MTEQKPETDVERKERTDLSSIQQTEAESAAAAANPNNRVSLESMLAKIKHEQYINPVVLPHMTIYVAVLENGFAIVGKSAPADAANFKEELGKKFAYEDAIRQMWQLEGYLMRNHIWMHEEQAR